MLLLTQRKIIVADDIASPNAAYDSKNIVFVVVLALVIDIFLMDAAVVLVVPVVFVVLVLLLAVDLQLPSRFIFGDAAGDIDGGGGDSKASDEDMILLYNRMFIFIFILQLEGHGTDKQNLHCHQLSSINANSFSSLAVDSHISFSTFWAT